MNDSNLNINIDIKRTAKRNKSYRSITGRSQGLSLKEFLPFEFNKTGINIPCVIDWNAKHRHMLIGTPAIYGIVQIKGTINGKKRTWGIPTEDYLYCQYLVLSGKVKEGATVFLKVVVNTTAATKDLPKDKQRNYIATQLCHDETGDNYAVRLDEHSTLTIEIIEKYLSQQGSTVDTEETEEITKEIEV